MAAGNDLDLLLVGVSHRTAPLELRESLAMDSEAAASRLRVALALEGVREAAVLSTCLRTEILVAHLPHDDEGRAAELERALRDLVLPGVPAESVAVQRDIGAVLHLFRVASGLESVVLGESQILAQVKDAHRIAREEGGAGRLLEPLLQQALATGKRLRRETAVGTGTLSIARAGIEIAAQVFESFEDVTTVVLGTGETGRLAARHLRERGAGELLLVNRSLARAEAAAEELGGEALGIEALEDALARADLVLACVENAPSIVSEASLARRGATRHDRPLVLVDLSVPRAVDPVLAGRPDVLVADLDHLAEIVDSNQEARERAAREATPILLAEVHKFLSLRSYSLLRPTIERLRERFLRAREEELDRRAGDETSPEGLELAHRLTRRLLDVALEELKASAREAVPAESIDRAHQRYLEGR